MNRAGFKGGGEGRANWAVAQGHPQLRGLHKKTVKKLLPKETQKYFLKLIIWNKKNSV